MTENTIYTLDRLKKEGFMSYTEDPENNEFFIQTKKDKVYDGFITKIFTVIEDIPSCKVQVRFTKDEVSAFKEHFAAISDTEEGKIKHEMGC